MKFTQTIVLTCFLTLFINSQAICQEPDIVAIRAEFAQALDDHDLDKLVSLLADDFVWDYNAQPAPIVGPEQFRGVMEIEYAVSPDWHTDQGLVLATDSVVVVKHAGHGTQTASRPEFPDIPPTGNPWIWPHIDIYEFEGEKIKQITTYADHAGVFMQLGILPIPESQEMVPSIELPDPEPTGLSPMEANAELFARWNNHDLAGLAKMSSDDGVTFHSALGRTVSRLESNAIQEMYFLNFTGAKLTPVRTIDLGDGWILCEYIGTSTHTKSFMGVPASGYPIEIRSAMLNHYDERGLITEQYVYLDNLTLLNQMTTAPWPLDGIWITTYPTGSGNIISTTVYVAQDAAKTRYSGTLEFLNSFGFNELYPDADPSLEKSAGGEAVLVGRNKYEATFLGYQRKYDASTGIMEIVGLSTAKAHFELLGPNLLQGYGTGSYYLAAQDADQDGFPDEGQEPIYCAPWTWTGKRLTPLPGCDLAPGE
jgi:ketosteroid isomerase-like protein